MLRLRLLGGGRVVQRKFGSGVAPVFGSEHAALAGGAVQLLYRKIHLRSLHMAPDVVIEPAVGESFALHLSARAAYFHINDSVAREAHELMAVAADHVVNAVLLR